MIRKELVLASELECRCRNRFHKAEGCIDTYQHVRAELDRLARQVRKIRSEIRNPKCETDSAYKLALTDVLNLISEAKQ